MRSTSSARFGETFFLIFTICRVCIYIYICIDMAFSVLLRVLFFGECTVGTRRLRISPQHGLEDVAVVLVIYSNLPNLTYNRFSLLPNGPPSSLQILNTGCHNCHIEALLQACQVLSKQASLCKLCWGPEHGCTRQSGWREIFEQRSFQNSLR